MQSDKRTILFVYNLNHYDRQPVFAQISLNPTRLEKSRREESSGRGTICNPWENCGGPGASFGSCDFVDASDTSSRSCSDAINNRCHDTLRLSYMRSCAVCWKYQIYHALLNTGIWSIRRQLTIFIHNHVYTIVHDHTRIIIYITIHKYIWQAKAYFVISKAHSTNVKKETRTS